MPVRIRVEPTLSAEESAQKRIRQQIELYDFWNLVGVSGDLALIREPADLHGNGDGHVSTWVNRSGYPVYHWNGGE